MKQKKEIKNMWNNKIYTENYYTRTARNKYFSKLLYLNYPNIKNILNVGGGGKRDLFNCLYNKNIKVFELDFTGDNDLTLNLDKIDKMPFKDNEFECVCCFDVLEHLENFHKITNELIRVSSGKIFISLPVSSSLFLNIIRNKRRTSNQEGYYFKFYGLPLEIPEDRHRWFLTAKDIELFFLNLAKQNNLKINFFSHNKNSLKFKFFKFLFRERIAKELILPFIWILLEKI